MIGHTAAGDKMWAGRARWQLGDILSWRMSYRLLASCHPTGPSYLWCYHEPGHLLCHYWRVKKTTQDIPEGGRTRSASSDKDVSLLSIR